MPVTRVDDPDADELEDYRTLSDPELRARRGLFVAEGRLTVVRLLTASRFAARSVLVTRTAYTSILAALELRPDLPVYIVSQELMNRVAGFNIHRGCLAIGERGTPPSWRELVPGRRTLLVLDGISDADNVGSLFRNAAAFGVDAVLLGSGCADPLYRKAVRTSMAASLRVPFATVDDVPQALAELRRIGTVCIALTPAASAPELHDVMARLAGPHGEAPRHEHGDRRGGVETDRREPLLASADSGHRRAELAAAPGAVALVVGHEGSGLSAAALEACDHRARIPMAPGVDSLNVATAAAIALYELTLSIASGAADQVHSTRPLASALGNGARRDA